MSNKERILIKNITIKNCGNFYGEHNIELSDSLDKNFTIIIGTSGMGKSTIFKLIYWCLFGSHYDPKTEVDSTDEGIINSTLLKNLGNGEKTSASVTLDIHDQDGEKYVLSRTLTATSHRETNSKKFRRSLFVVQDIKKGELFNQNNIKSIRPSNGLHTKYYDEILGKEATENIEYGTPLNWNLIKINKNK